MCTSTLDVIFSITPKLQSVTILIGPNVTLTTASHEVSPVLRGSGVTQAPISIGDNVWLGAGVVVLPGVKIGNNSVVAANSVVLSDVPENVLYAGTPAVFKRNI